MSNKLSNLQALRETLSHAEQDVTRWQTLLKEEEEKVKEIEGSLKAAGIDPSKDLDKQLQKKEKDVATLVGTVEQLLEELGPIEPAGA